MDRSRSIRGLLINVPISTEVRSDKDSGEITEVSGTIYQFFRTIADSMRLNYTLTDYSTKGYAGASINGLWTGMMGALQNGSADISVSPLAIDAERFKVIDFSSVISAMEIDVIGATPPPKLPPVTALLKAFDSRVWWLLLASIISLVLTSALKIKSTNKEFGIVFDRSDISRTCLDIVSILYGKSAARGPEDGVRRVLFGSWLLAMLILGNCFSGLAGALMLLPIEPFKIQSMADLASSFHSVTPLVIADTAIEDYFENGETDDQQRIWQTIMHGHGRITSEVMYLPETLKSVSLGKYVIVNVVDPIKSETAKHCQNFDLHNIYVGKEPVFTLFTAFGFRKNLDKSLVNEMNKRILWLREAYSLEKELEWNLRHFDTCKSLRVLFSQKNPLGFQELKEFLKFVIATLALSVLMLILELIVHSELRRQRSNGRRKDRS